MKYQCPICGASLGYQGLCWKCRAEQERNAVLAWTDEEVEKKVQNIIAHAERLEDWDSEEFRDACMLQAFRGVCPPELQRVVVQADIQSLERFCYHAPADVREMLIERLYQAEDAHEAANLMCCLAMQGDEQALTALFELEKNPRPWRKKLYVDPSVYAQCGGWTFDQQGQRQVLNYDTCYALEKGDRQTDQAASIGRPREDYCPHCGCRMVDILVLDGRDQRLKFLGVDGIITATCCPNCVGFTEASFSRFTLDGGSIPMPSKLVIDSIENYVGEDGYTELTTNTYVLGQKPVPVFYGVGGEDVHTIGGFANWVQDWQYTICPECGKPMRYLAQIQWDMVMENMEGTLYIELCPDCHIVSMQHQQT